MTELKYFIDLFYGGGSCGVLWSCRADNRSMTRLRPWLRSEAVCSLLLCRLIELSSPVQTPSGKIILLIF